MGSNSSSVPPTSPEQQRLFELQEKVFNNDLILDTIIRQSVECGTSAQSRKQAGILRLVNKEWFLQTNLYFWRCEKPLFMFKMYEPLFENEEKVQTKNFAKFIRDVEVDTLLENHSAPLGLNADVVELLLPHSIEFKTLQTFFSQKSSASYFLVELHFYNFIIWSSASIFPQIPENFKLPHLRDLTICDFRRGEDQLPAGTVDKYQVFVQSLLNSTEKLKKFRISFVSQITNDFADLMLPPSLIELTVSPQKLMTLLTSSFNTQSPSSSTSRLNLPHLKQLTWRGGNWQPMQTTMSYQIGKNFRACMPQVEKLEVKGIQENVLINVLCHRWWLNWPTITTLAIGMSILTTTQCIEHIHDAFGVLVNLELEWYLGSPLRRQYADPLRSALGLIFRKMTQLRSLKINILSLEYVEEFEWDSLIIGTTSARAKELREDPSLWEDFLKEDIQNSSEQGQKDNSGEQQMQKNSIRDLKHLRRLHLSGKFSYIPHDYVPFPARTPPPSLMSMLAFRLGFMQLAQLNHVTLKLGFAFGMSEVAEECMKEFPGRTIQIIDYSFDNNDDGD